MNKKPLSVKDGCLTFLLGFLVCQLCVLAVSFFAAIFCSIAKISTDLTSYFNTALGYMFCSIAMNAGLILIFFIFNKNKENQIFSKPKLNKTVIYLLVAVVAFFTLYPIINCIDSLLIELGVELNTIPYEINTKSYFISLISLVLLPAVCEELLFRGTILKSLKPLGKWFSIITTAIMFAVFHMSIDQLIYPLLMGLLLSYIMYKENNLLYCIIVHLVNNFLSLTFSYFNINLIFNHWTYILLAIILVVIFISILLYLILKEKTQEKGKMDSNNKFYFVLCSAVMVILWIIINVYKFL